MITIEAGLVTQKSAAEHISIATSQLMNRNPEVDRILASPEMIEHNLCGYPALAAVINTVLDRICVTDFPQDGTISVGEMVYHALRLHNTLSSDEVPVWKAVTETGDIYHQALVSVAEGLQVHTRAVHGFEGVGDFDHFLENGGGILLSVRNTFINGETLRRQQQGSEKLKEGTHIISVLGYNPEDQTYTVFDPYGKAEVMQLPAKPLNTYLPSTPRAIALARNEETLSLTQHIPETSGIYRNEFLRKSIDALMKQRQRRI